LLLLVACRRLGPAVVIAGWVCLLAGLPFAGCRSPLRSLVGHGSVVAWSLHVTTAWSPSSPGHHRFVTVVIGRFILIIVAWLLSFSHSGLVNTLVIIVMSFC
jgi:hypothetical protein